MTPFFSLTGQGWGLSLGVTSIPDPEAISMLWLYHLSNDPDYL